MNDSRTEDLFAELAATEDLREYLDVHDFRTLSLSEYLQQELSARGLRQTDVLRRADIGQTFGWYVFNGQRGMSRNNVLRLCFAMGFELRHAQRALSLAGVNGLHPKNRRDAIIVYCLSHGSTLREANDTLYAFGEECL